jgi:hypothetical protein
MMRTRLIFDFSLQVLLRENLPGLPPPDLLRAISGLPRSLSPEFALQILPEHKTAFHQAVHRE